MATTQTRRGQRTVKFPKKAVLDGVAVVELESGRPVFASNATRRTTVDADAELALSIPEHDSGRSAELLAAFRPGTFQALYIGNGTVSDADIEAAANHWVGHLELGWIHLADSFRGEAARRLVLDVKPETFFRCNGLGGFAARHCDFGDDALSALFTGSSPGAVILEDTVVTPDGLDAASRPGLQELVYSENRSTYPGATSFGDWPDLARLTMNRAGLIDDQLGSIAALKRLVILELPNNDIFRRISHCLDDLPNLRRLDLARTRINDTTIESLCTLRNLQRLDLSATAITDDALAALTDIEGLTGLFLGSCDITNDGLARIVEEQPNLTVLDVSRTLITPEAVPLLTRLPKLRRLEISQEMVCQEFLDLADRFPSLGEFGFRGGVPFSPLAAELVDYFGAANWIGAR